MDSSDIQNYINPFYVFSGSVGLHRYIDIQTRLLDELGPEEYFMTQLNVLHSSISLLVSEIKDSSDNKFRVNTNIMGNA